MIKDPAAEAVPGPMTAYQALCFAVSGQACADSLPDPGQSDFEIRVLARAFLALTPSLANRWNDAPLEIARAARTHFINGADAGKIAAAARSVAEVLAHYLDPDKTDSSCLAAATLQIAAAVMSLMKRYPSVEYKMYAADCTARIWGREAGNMLTAYFDRAPAPSGRCPDDGTRHTAETRVSAEISDDDDGLNPDDRRDEDGNRSIEYKIRCAAAIRAWLCRDAGPVRAPDPMLHNMLTAIRRYEEGNSTWFSHILRNPGGIRPSGDFWPKSPDGAWPAFSEFTDFWTALALNDAGAPGQALEYLERTFADGAQSPCLWWLFAGIAADAGQFGAAENAILRASAQCPGTYAAPVIPPTDDRPFFEMPREIWLETVAQTAQKLAQKALSCARAARGIDPPLLELAMKYGSAQTTAEAALCIFDADIADCTDSAVRTLAQNSDARRAFIDALARRRDTSDLDRTFGFFQKLSEFVTDAPEMHLFDAVTKLDAPEAAADPARRALRDLPPVLDIYWTALDLWLDIMQNVRDFEQAAAVAAPAVALDDPRASKALLTLMAAVPRGAFPAMQTILCENIGPEATANAFMRLKNLENPYHTLNERIQRDALLRKSHTAPRSPGEIAEWMMPITWQAAHTEAHRNTDHEAQEKDRRRNEVFLARGISQKKTDPPPEPAHWIHVPQHRASDAFDP